MATSIINHLVVACHAVLKNVVCLDSMQAVKLEMLDAVLSSCQYLFSFIWLDVKLRISLSNQALLPILVLVPTLLLFVDLFLNRKLYGLEVLIQPRCKDKRHEVEDKESQEYFDELDTEYFEPCRRFHASQLEQKVEKE